MTTLTPGALEAALVKHFGLGSFRPWQKEAIVALLETPSRVLVVAPTGGGKSLVYQLPATLLDGTTLVLSPLVALMEDQVRALLARGIPATFLASTLEPAERRRREQGLYRGEYRLVYAAPERLASEAFVDLLCRTRIPLVAVDEAHCISQWGHDFRPDYLRVGDLVARLSPEHVVACTATATPRVRAELAQRLGLGARCVEILRGFARPNLHLSAHAVSGSRDTERRVSRALGEALGGPDRPRGAAIVYAATRREADSWAEWLKDEGYRSAVYHAGRDAAERSETNRMFSAREIDVVAATNAFGMGIDRPDIRAVVHAQPAASIEAYYQEVGRAGRDGLDAHGTLLCSDGDIALRRFLAEQGKDGEPAPAATFDRAWRLFLELLRYFEARSCRHDFILRYFGDEQELLGGCGHCDVCEALDRRAGAAGKGADAAGEDEETGIVVRKALSAVARGGGRAGLGAVAEMLLGAETARIRRLGFSELSTFGLFRDQPEAWVTGVLRTLLAAGWVDLTSGKYPLAVLTPAGRQVMTGRAPARVLLPAVRAGAARSGGATRPKRRKRG